MKPPRPKPHLIISPFSESPVILGNEVEAFCGAKLSRVRWAWTEGEILDANDFLERLGVICRFCRAKYESNFGEGAPEAAERIRIGAVIEFSGQEAKQEG